MIQLMCLFFIFQFICFLFWTWKISGLRECHAAHTCWYTKWKMIQFDIYDIVDISWYAYQFAYQSYQAISTYIILSLVSQSRIGAWKPCTFKQNFKTQKHNEVANKIRSTWSKKKESKCLWLCSGRPWAPPQKKRFLNCEYPEHAKEIEDTFH